QREHGLHLRRRIQGRDKVHLGCPGVGEGGRHSALQQRADQCLSAVHEFGCTLEPIRMGSQGRVRLWAVRVRADRPLRLAPATVLDYRELARRRLPRQLFDYLDGGAYEEATMRANVSDLERVLLRQVVMRDVAVRDQRV